MKIIPLSKKVDGKYSYCKVKLIESEKKIKGQTILLDSKIVDTIKSMSLIEMARLWRFAPAGHIYFDSSLPYYMIFEKRFELLGGMTPTISKLLG